MRESTFLRYLIDNKVVSEVDAARLDKVSGQDTAEALQSLSILTGKQVAEHLAAAYDYEPVSLSKHDGPFLHIKVNEELVRENSGQNYLRERWMPVSVDDARNEVRVVITKEPDDAMHASIAEHFPGKKIRFYVTTIWEMRQRLLEIYRDNIVHDAVESLHERNPLLSAKIVFTRTQKVGGVLMILAAVAAFVFAPLETAAALMVVMSLAFLLSIVFKYVVSLFGARSNNINKYVPGEIENLDEDALPMYTVLVPVFKEANIVHLLVKNLGKLDYPQNKVEVLILTEEEDQETRDAIAAANPPSNFRNIVVPKGRPGDPQTKPRACNVGLDFASGEYCVIFDAEDAPEPDQLKKAIVGFRKGGPNVICIQAALNYHNDRENALTTMFTLEYSFWFDYMLAGLDELKLPIPLGGTSNHFRTEALRELGGWDGWNVTEDADLGIRATVEGYTVQVIDSTTMEEANNSIPNFVRQRSRWIKGYMQTAIVHFRNPFWLVKNIGLKETLSFLLLIAGTPLTFLAVIPLYLLFGLILFVPFLGDIFAYLPDWAIILAIANFVVGNGLMIHLSMMGPFKRGKFGLIFWSFLNPVYWLLHSVAAYKGLYELFFKPHYWQKTLHGLTKEQIDA